MKHLLQVRDWPSAFDVVVCNANKPSFFSQRDRVFKTSGPKWSFVDEPAPGYIPVKKFLKGHMYHGGCMREMMKLSDWEGEEILFFGDHVYSDLADPILFAGWRTAAIVPELDEELDAIHSKTYQTHLATLSELELKISNFKDPDMSRELIQFYMNQRQEVKSELRKVFNPYFGSLFRCNIQPSYFHRQLSRYAEIYTSSISNLSEIPLCAKLYPNRGYLPHEVLA